MSEKLLIINEKPSQFKNFSKALGGETGTFNGDEYALIHLYGHILGNPVPEKTARKEYAAKVGKFSNTKNIPWDWRWFNFNNKVLKDKSFKAIVENIQGYLKHGYIPVIASDIDRSGEGDLLVWEVLIAINYQGKVYREYHDDEAKKSIIKALKNKKVVDRNDPQLRAAEARSAMDFMTQELTRVSTMKLINKGYRLPHTVPIGRLQSAIMRLIGDQEKAIKAYKPSKVYESRYKLGDLVLSRNGMPQFKTEAEWKHDDLPDESMVKETKAVRGETIPPKALTLSKLVGIMGKYNLSAKQTLKQFQAMYDKHILSYPRTEDNFVTPEQFNDMAPIVDNILDILGLPKAAFTHRQPRSTHVKLGASHGALRPGLTLPKSLEALDKEFGKGSGQIYKEVGDRYMMMYLENTEWVRHEYETVDTPKPFTGSIKVITRQGVVDPDHPDDSVGKKLPDLSQPAKIYAHAIKSHKPHKPDSAWLLGQLTKNDVGTEATRAQTFARLAGNNGNYPIKDGSSLKLTTIGWIGYYAAQGTKIGSIAGTKYLGSLIDKVRNGNDFGQVFDEFQQTLNEDIATIRNGVINVDELGLEKAAPREIAKGTWNNREVAFNRHYGSHRFSDDEVEELLNGDEITIELKTKDGKTVKAKGKLAEQTYKGKKFIGFSGQMIREGYVSGVWNGQKVTVKGSYMDYKFTPEEMQQLFDGESVDFITHKGDKTYNLTGKLAEQTYQGKKFVGIKAEFPLRDGYIRQTWHGKTVDFKKSFMDYQFTNDDIEKLVNDEEIAFITHKGEKSYHVHGKLEIQDYQGHKFVGFKPQFDMSKREGYVQGTFKGKQIQFKGEFMNHKFEPDEITELLAGHNITFKGISKKGTEMDVTGKLAKQSYQGRTFYGFKPDFGKK